jgi:hypothetical protein
MQCSLYSFPLACGMSSVTMHCLSHNHIQYLHLGWTLGLQISRGWRSQWQRKIPWIVLYKQKLRCTVMRHWDVKQSAPPHWIGWCLEIWSIEPWNPWVEALNWCDVALTSTCPPSWPEQQLGFSTLLTYTGLDLSQSEQLRLTFLMSRSWQCHPFRW